MGDEYMLGEERLGEDFHAVRCGRGSRIGTLMGLVMHAILLSTASEALLSPSKNPESSKSMAKASLKGSLDSISRYTVESLFILEADSRARRDW